MTIPRGRRAYNRVSADAEEEVPDDSVTETSTTGTDEEASTTTDAAPLADENAAAEEEEDHIELVIMDPAHRKFKVSADPEWTVKDLKQQGTKIHKVPAASQRLIYMGRLLQDEDTLQDVGLTEPKTIIHLFPKPRVVISSGTGAEETMPTNDGAHIPRIVLDPDEAERRSSILVLGSAEIMEAQNNVRLLSFLLLIICSMELLALFTIMLGVPPQDSDDPSEATPPPSNGTDDQFYPPNEMEIRTWRNSDYIDLVISTFGFYVATLGIKATTENTMRLARQYLAGTIVVGIAWNVYYYFLNVQAGKEAYNSHRGESSDDDFVPAESEFYAQALFAMMLPAMLWFMCCARAWQFHRLLQEAEEEAETRIRNEISELEEGNSIVDNRPDDDGDPELALQDERARIT